MPDETALNDNTEKCLYYLSARCLCLSPHNIILSARCLSFPNITNSFRHFAPPFTTHPRPCHTLFPPFLTLPTHFSTFALPLPTQPRPCHTLLLPFVTLPLAFHALPIHSSTLALPFPTQPRPFRTLLLPFTTQPRPFHAAPPFHTFPPCLSPHNLLLSAR